MKAEVEKLEIAKLVNASTSLNNLKPKVSYLDVGKLKTVPADLKKLSDVEFNTIKTKVKNLDKKSLYTTTLIHINQYNTDK